MTKPVIQVRKLLLGLLLAFVWAGPTLGEVIDKSGPAGAGGQEPVSWLDALGGVADSVVDIIPTKDDVTGLFDKKKAKPKEVLKPKEESKPATKTDPKLEDDGLIRAKKMDVPQDHKTKEPASQPYKVYHSPALMDERSAVMDPYEAARDTGSSSTTFSGWQKETVKTLDPSTPPPLPNYVQDEIDGKPVDQRHPKPTLKNITQVELPKTNVPPISALPKQFFPILPANMLTNSLPQLLPVASNEPLEAPHTNVRRAIVIIHDIQRNAAEGVATLMTLSGADGQTTLIVAPQFPLELDIVRFAAYLPDDGKNVARWTIGNSWQTGGESHLASSRQGISSFTALDLLLLFLSDHQRFPMLEKIIIAGHGLGGDFVHRYAAAGRAPSLVEKQGIDLRYLVANASSYLYFTAQRPVSIPHCREVNAYPFGITGFNDYVRQVGASALRLDYPMHKVTYLVGDLINPDHYLDQTCAAMAQGTDRLSRFKNYAFHLIQSFGQTVTAHQSFATVSHAGYDPVSLYGSSCGMSVLFGDGVCSSL